MKSLQSFLALFIAGICIPHNCAGFPPYRYPYWWGSYASAGSSCGVPGYFVNPFDCTKFYRCVDQTTADGALTLVRFDYDCPQGTVFDQGSKVCIHSRDSHCGWYPVDGWTGWNEPAKNGWTPPPPKKSPGWGWSPSKGTWVHVHNYDPINWGWGWDRTHSYWTFGPGGSSSYVLVYDTHGKKRSVENVSRKLV